MSPPRIKYLVALKVFEPELPLQNKITGFYLANKLTVLSISFQNFPFLWAFSDVCVEVYVYENLPRGMRGRGQCVSIQVIKLKTRPISY